MKYLFLGLIVALSSCASKKDRPVNYLSVLTFNVENLFDTQHDLGKQDYTYLPAELKRGSLRESVRSYCNSLLRADWKKECLHVDWNERRLNEKLLRVVQVISESTTGCPDILVLQEIENEQILKRLKTMLPCAYTAMAISDDRDARGIDVALLSKFPTGAGTTRSIPFTYASVDARKDSRGVLDVDVNVRGYWVRVLGLHLPAPAHPVHIRRESVKYLEKLFYDSQRATLIAGDWNIPVREESEHQLLGGLRRSFTFSDDLIRSSSPHTGTTFYPHEKSWSFLDKIALSRNAFDRVDCRVVNILSIQRDERGRPVSFPLSGKLDRGVSDHFPVLCRASY